jgi:hypothetical protein
VHGERGVEGAFSLLDKLDKTMFSVHKGSFSLKAEDISAFIKIVMRNEW